MTAQHDITVLPLKALLDIDSTNVRKTDRGATADFIASIKAHGIRLPLIVRKNGKESYTVIDGAKRLAAAQALVKSGDYHEDQLIPVIDATGIPDAEAREISLTLNLIRTEMHPVDAYRAFAALHEDKNRGLDVEAIAARFGIEKQTVKKRLALGALHDDILNAYAAGDLDNGTIAAFTLCPDKQEQARIYAKLAKDAKRNHWKVQAHQVKEALKIGSNNPGRYLPIIGQEAYEARGGKVTVDLFGKDHVVSNPDLLRQMINEKLDAVCAKLLADGWSWATHDVPDNAYMYARAEGGFDPTPAEKKKLDKLAKAADDESGDADEALAASDEYEILKAEIEKRSYSADTKKKAGCFVTLSVHNNEVQIDYGRIEPKAEKPAQKGAAIETRIKTAATKAAKPVQRGISQALQARLFTARRTALRSVLIASWNGNNVPGVSNVSAKLLKLLAGVIAAQIHPDSRYSWAPNEIVKAETALLDAIDPKIINAALRKQFDAKDYFGGCGKALCLVAITEALNVDEARKIGVKKGGEIAKFAVTNVGASGWLPKELRTSSYDAPKPPRVSLVKEAAKRAAKKPTKKR